jgi:hypothetical protein
MKRRELPWRWVMAACFPIASLVLLVALLTADFQPGAAAGDRSHHLLVLARLPLDTSRYDYPLNGPRAHRYCPLDSFTTLNRDGSPQVSVVWMGIENDETVSGAEAEGRRLNELAQGLGAFIKSEVPS